MEHPAEHVEHVEHQQHAAHNPFDRKVAMTMAIVAAGLAAVTLLSHRSHNETLRLQTKASDQWNFYQAKNIRQHEYEAYILLLGSVAKDPSKEEEAKKAMETWEKQIKKYKIELPRMMEEAKEMEKGSHANHQQAFYFDMGELGIELALVFCSLAVLTKRIGFWFSGMAVGILGAIVASLAFILPHH
jgi:hypothetical protein